MVTRIGSPLPQELGDEILTFLDPEALKNATATSRGSKKRIYEEYRYGYKDQEDLLETYAASQPAPEARPLKVQKIVRTLSENPLKPAAKPLIGRVHSLTLNPPPAHASLPKIPEYNPSRYLAARAQSLVCKSDRLSGGYHVRNQATQFGAGSVYHPQAQGIFAEARNGSKVIGLLPFLKAMPGAQEFLTSLNALKTNFKKFQAMKKWLHSHEIEAAQVRTVKAVCWKERDLEQVVKPDFNGVGRKVYNFIPREIRYFTGVVNLILNNNMLTSLPEELSQLRSLQVLHLESNHLKQMPPALPSLRELHLEYNENIPFENFANFIRQFVNQRGQWIRISISQGFDDSFPALVDELKEKGYELERKKVANQYSFTVTPILEPTQPLEL